MDQAEKLIRSYEISTGKKWFTADTPMQLTDQTPDEARRKMNLAIFEVTFGKSQESHYLALRGDKVIDLAGPRQLVAFHVEQMEVADLNGDGHPELLYVYTCGSGVQYTSVCVLRPGADAPAEVFGIIMEHVKLSKKDDQTVDLLQVPWRGETTLVGTLGTLHNDKATGLAKVDVADKLPDELQKEITVTRETPLSAPATAPAAP